jgi:hypothetical protein
MSLNKKFLINQLLLPFDIIDNIKSFVFYDKTAFETILFIRNKKREITELFATENIIYYSFHDWANNPELVRTWHVNFGNDNSNGYKITFMIEADMCLCCGNYVNSNNEFLPRNIRCKCVGYYI